ncbi:MAG: hypothetical protein HFG09_08055 [Oscillibacter sp.]|nr:hypothetical protein [Oscillibacter sp.]
MGFFQRIGNGIARFMYGRNGMDQLNRALLVGYLLLSVLRSAAILWLKSRPLVLATDLLLYLSAVLLLFRMFSKNLPKRQAENQRFVSWRWRAKNRSASARARHADKDHKYFTCKHCKAICRVPVGKGKIIITCPKCGAQIQAKT